jgi:hypothetical protein
VGSGGNENGVCFDWEKEEGRKKKIEKMRKYWENLKKILRKKKKKKKLDTKK